MNYGNQEQKPTVMTYGTENLNFAERFFIKIFGKSINGVSKVLSWLAFIVLIIGVINIICSIFDINFHITYGSTTFCFFSSYLPVEVPVYEHIFHYFEKAVILEAISRFIKK